MVRDVVPRIAPVVAACPWSHASALNNSPESIANIDHPMPG